MPISIVNPNIQEPVSNIVITSEDRVDQGINVATMVVSWTQAKGAVKYQVEWRKDDGSWIKLPITGNNSIEVPGIYAGNYQAKVSAVNASDISSLPTYSVVTKLNGKQGLPPALAFIQATGILFGMRLNGVFRPQVHLMRLIPRFKYRQMAQVTLLNWAYLLIQRQYTLCKVCSQILRNFIEAV